MSTVVSVQALDHLNVYPASLRINLKVVDVTKQLIGSLASKIL